MIVYAVLAAGFALGVFLILRGLSKGGSPQLLATLIKWILGALGIVGLLYLAVTGKLAAALGAVTVLGPLYLQWRAQKNREKAARGPSPGQRSTITTRHLRMELDHDSGSLDGEIRDGPLSGKWLSSLTLEEQLYVLKACTVDDPEGVRVMTAFLDRTHGASWREDHDGDFAQQGDDQSQGSGGGPMGREEALAILGLKAGATRDQIIEAHRTLIKKLHPDQGGSDWLAARINQAKETLI